MTGTPHSDPTEGVADSSTRSLRTIVGAVMKVSPTEVIEADQPEDVAEWRHRRRGLGGQTGIVLRAKGPRRVLTRVTLRGMTEGWPARVLAVIALAIAAGFALATTVALGSVEQGLGNASLDSAPGADLVLRGRITTSSPLEVVRSGLDDTLLELVETSPGVTWVDGRISGPVVVRLGDDPAIAAGLLAGTTYATWSDRLDLDLGKGRTPSRG